MSCRGFRAVVFVAGLVFSFAVARHASATPIDAVKANINPGVFAGCEAFVCGFEFTPTTNITVVALGQYDQAGNGLAGSPAVGLWTLGGTLLASATVPSGTVATLSNGVRYVSIAPLALTAGVHYVIGSAAGPDGADYTAVLVDFAPEITPITGRFIAGTSLAFPPNLDSRLFVGPSFEFDAAATAVPEPASMFLLGTGIVGIGARRWRNRRRRL